MLKTKELKKQLLIAKKNLNFIIPVSIFFNQKMLSLPFFSKNKAIFTLNKFVIKYSRVFPSKFVTHVKFPLQGTSFSNLNLDLKKFFISNYNKLLVKMGFFIIKLKSLNILESFNVVFIFFLLVTFLNTFFFNLTLYYQIFHFNKALTK